MAHILLLTDRDWTHPQGGGTGSNLFGQVAYWLSWGHRVTVVSGAYEGAERVERPAEGLELHHMGSRLTVFPQAWWAVTRGVGRDADVVLEVDQRDRVRDAAVAAQTAGDARAPHPPRHYVDRAGPLRGRRGAGARRRCR